MEPITIESLGRATALWVGFVGGLFLLRKIVPGKVHLGQTLRDGTKKSYKLNAFTLPRS